MRGKKEKEDSHIILWGTGEGREERHHLTTPAINLPAREVVVGGGGGGALMPIGALIVSPLCFERIMRAERRWLLSHVVFGCLKLFMPGVHGYDENCFDWGLIRDIIHCPPSTNNMFLLLLLLLGVWGAI